jgi:hypothetical protein
MNIGHFAAKSDYLMITVVHFDGSVTEADVPQRSEAYLIDADCSMDSTASLQV